MIQVGRLELGVSMRWGLIAWRGLKPMLGVVVASAVSGFFLYRLADALGAQHFGRLWDVWFWATEALLLVTGGWFTWRILGWQSDRHDGCDACGGPLGWLRPGKVWYGKQLSDFRRCWNCNRPNACT